MQNWDLDNVLLIHSNKFTGHLYAKGHLMSVICVWPFS